MSTNYDKNMSFKSDGRYWIEDVPLASQEVSFSINIERHGFHKAMEAAKEMSRNIPHLIHYYCQEILHGYTPYEPRPYDPNTNWDPRCDGDWFFSTPHLDEQKNSFEILIQALGFDQALEEIKRRGYDIETILKNHFTK